MGTCGAAAHAPAELTQFVSLDPSRLLLATNRGLIVGQREPRALAWLCIEALGIGVNEPYRLARVGPSRLLVASGRGLQESDDQGCTWSPTEVLGDVWVSSLQQHPHEGNVLYVATAGAHRAGVLVTRDGGASFETLLSLADDEYVSSLLVAPDPPVQIYASVRSGPTASPRAHYVASSSDGGVNWEKTTLQLLPTERGITLLSVNLTRPNELLVHVHSRTPELGERALLSRDGARTFAQLGMPRMLRAAAFTQDGAYAFLASVDGLAQAALEAPQLEPVGKAAWLSLLEVSTSGVFAAGYYQGIDAQRNGVGVRLESAGEFQPWLDFGEVSELVACPEPSLVRATCELPLRDWRLENQPLGQPAEADAGPSSLDAGHVLVDVGSADAAALEGDAARTAIADGAPPDSAPTSHAPAQGPADGALAGTPAPRRQETDGCTLAGLSTNQADAILTLTVLVGALSQRSVRRREPDGRR